MIFPFFVGAARSGTTLLRAMFDSRPDMAVPWESYFVVGLSRQLDRYQSNGGFAVDRFLDDLTGRHFPRWGLAAGEVRDAVLEGRPGDYAEAVRLVFALYASRHGKTRYGDKTPDYVFSMPALAGLFPESRFVHIVRDGRDVALSLLDVTWGPGTVEEAALWWREATSAGRLAGRELGPDRYREVRYEDLVDDPPSVLRPLCRFLALEWTPQMLRYFERADELAGADLFPQHHQRLALPPTKGLRDWRSRMTPDQLAKFHSVAGDLLQELDYAG